MRQHFVETGRGKPILDLRLGWKQGAAMLHLMHMNYEDWRHKLPMRLSGSSLAGSLKPMLARLLGTGDEAGLRALFDQLFVTKPECLQRMQQEGAIAQVLPDPDHAVAGYFPA